MYVRSQLLKALLPFALVSQTLALPTMSFVGCFSSSDGLTEYGTFNYQSSGNCQKDCVGNGNQAVLGLTNANDCWCGSEMPPNSTQVSDSQCNTPCVGWPNEDCGANGFWTVWLTGTSTDVKNAEGSSSGSSATSAQSSAAAAQTTASAAAQTTNAGTATQQQPSVITSIAPGKTVVVTESPSAEQSSTSSTSAIPQKKSGGTNITAVVIGVVVGIVVLCAIAGAAFFFIRHRRRQRTDGEYKQNRVSAFMAGGKPMIPANKRGTVQMPNSSDPEAMAQRRMSDGSIADNEDYSRRILKVTNPDDR